MNASYFNVASFDMDIHRSLPKKKSFTAEDDADCSDCCTGAVCPDGDAEVTEHCTDKCVVIACEDSSHHIDAAGCAPDPCDFLCDLDPCRGCHPLDDFFEKCCEPDFHHSFPEKHSIFHPTFHWDPSSICRSCDEPEELPLSSSSSHFPDPHLPDMNRFSHQQPLHPHVFQQPHGPQACLWGNCGQQFEDSDQLIKHVNEVHFLLPSSPSVSIPQSNTLPCLWGDCHQSLPVTPQAYGHALSQMMANHLLNDHLNSQWPVHFHPSTPILDYSLPSSESESVPTPPHVHTPCSGTHVCHWKDCDQAFVTCSDLTTHLTVAHVGAGKAHYDCHWKECNRNGNHGFASKQKICRHLQSHTGHRPFQCRICKQHFSEAATLQQHMRRHTLEKPYACDHPGCEKKFAIAGALTIHKRIHNGEKPFKCTYCERAFTESSNLSKHLRTHTGARPYPCTEPGCSKTFARPDQLTRHKITHTKNR